MSDKKHILFIVENNQFPQDIRVYNEAKVAYEYGFEVSVISPQRVNKKDRKFEVIDGISVYRHPMPFEGSSKIGLLLEYINAIFWEFLLSINIFVNKPFQIIHSANPPDHIFILALLFKLFGVKYIFDHHDLAPDLYQVKYGNRHDFIYKLLQMLEKLSCQIADIVIATNESYKKIEIERCRINCKKIYVVRNGPDLNVMKISTPIKSIRSRAKTIMCYLGSIGIQDGVDNLMYILSKIVFQYGYSDICLMIIGDGDYLFKIKKLAKKLNLNKYIYFTGLILDRGELNRYLSSADLFVDAAPYSFLNNNSTFIKHMEYMIYGKPVVSFALKESIFTLHNAAVFIPPNDIEKMAKTIVSLIQDENEICKLGLNAKERIISFAWDKVSAPLIEAYENILSDHRRKR